MRKVVEMSFSQERPVVSDDSSSIDKLPDIARYPVEVYGVIRYNTLNSLLSADD